ncbi:MAG: glycoside hydrolase family 28 protein [Microbacter sp.]
MKLLKLFLFAALVPLSQWTFGETTQDEVNALLQHLPFPSFTIQIPSFPDKHYLVTDFGAVGDATTNSTKAINDAIAACSKNGGGTVIVPAGIYISAQIEMRSNVNLHLNTGAMIVFSPNINDYPLVKTGSGYGINPLIYGSHLTNVAITGNGSFDGNGQYWRPVKKEKMTARQWSDLLKKGGVLDEKGTTWYPNHQAAEGQAYLSGKKKSELTEADYEKVKTFLRPKMLSLEHCSNVLVEGITLKNPPNFNMIMRSVNGLVVSHVKVMNDWWIQNGDGLDIGNCKNVLMYDCTVNSGDDGICMKSSRSSSDEYALENVVIKNCTVFHAHGGFVIGSNTDGNVHNIYVNNCSYTGTDVGLRFKSNIGRGGKVDHIYIDSIFMKDIANEAVLFDLTYEDNAAVKNSDVVTVDHFVPDFSDIFIRHVVCDGASAAFRINGSKFPMVHNISVANSIFKTDRGISSILSDHISFTNCDFTVAKKPAVDLSQTHDWLFNQCAFHQSKGIIMRLSGSNTQGIVLKQTPTDKEEIEYLDGASPGALSFQN